MKVFLVRHGQSQDRVEKKIQGPQSPLSNLGKSQAEALAKRFLSEKIDAIISSPLPRAFQTAESISFKTNIQITQEPLLVEQEEPIVFGVSTMSKSYQDYLREEKKHLFETEWKYQNKGESINDVIKRALKFKRNLESNYQGQTVLIMSHGFLMRALIAVCLFGQDCPSAIIARFIRLTVMKNTNITEMTFDENEKLWKLSYLNDDLHLKEL